MTTLNYPLKVVPGSKFEAVMNSITPVEFKQLEDKLRTAQMVLAQSVKKGGAPFVYIFSASKNHYLADISNTLYVDDQGNEVTLGTAATDGKNYYWHPDVLRKYTVQEIAVVQFHETLHTVFLHCDLNRTMSKNKRLWNIAVDYMVDGTIEHDYRKAGYINDYSGNGEGHEHQLWKGNLHKPLFYKDLLNGIKKEAEDLKAGIVSKNKKRKKEIVKEEDLRCYSDYSLYSKSPEDIYEELEKATQDLTDEMLEQLVQKMGGNGGDQHMPSNIDKNELIQEVLSAMQYSKQMGNTPGFMEEQLQKLMEPRLSWQDLVRISLQRFMKDRGNIKDWSRMKRRELSLGFFRPKYKEQRARFAAFLDTSGSMSLQDMEYCISQLKALDSRATGILIPNDASPKWDAAIDIYRASDLQKTKLVGRAGTCFKEIFDDYPKKIGNDFDVIIVLTDGGIFDMAELKKPKAHVVWVLCNDDKNFSPPFGKVAPLRTF